MKAILAALLLTGCAAYTPAPKVITQTVKVPVPIMPVPPPELATCGTHWPEIQFSPAEKPALVTLDKPNAEALMLFGNTAVQCIKAWQAWSKQ
ncbi:hypothetical protein [Sphingomonas sp.]|jgi:hypothetical protein|uniref:hypothetical protein n=1 Tax=Sphingomonas sp. TaxID=28214 RepID=UPI00356AFDB8